MKLHVLAGLPRSGSTLLGNILAQHPDIHVTGTSSLTSCVQAISNTLSASAEAQGELANVRGSYGRYLGAVRAFVDGYYADRSEAHVVDKNRGWVLLPHLLRQISPDSVIVVTVRDPRDVIASIERRHRETAVFVSPVAPTIWEAASRLMGPDGMVGGPIKFCEDLMRRSVPRTVYVPYEALVAAPEQMVSRIEREMGVEPFVHDFQNIANVATDLDALYRGKYPHDGSGAIKPSGRPWNDTLDADLAARIASVFPMYMQSFGYR